MTGRAPILLALWCVLAAASVGASFFDPFPGLALLRASPAALLAVLAVQGTRALYGPWVAVGIVFGCAGDYLLATLSSSLFVPGLVAFLVGHLAYIVAFARRWQPTRARLVVAGLVLAWTTTFATIVVWRDPVVDGKSVAFAIVGYVVVISTMAVLALGHRAGNPLVAWGAVIFVVSDSHVPTNFLLLPKPLTLLVVTGYATYYTAQFLIIEGTRRAALAEARSLGSP